MFRAIPKGAVFGILIVCCYGCESHPDYRQFIPSKAGAREALETVLKAWQQNQPALVTTSQAPRIEVIDSHRRPGQTLRAYEILGEILAEDGPRCFAVRLTMENPTEEQKGRFCVVGKDPLWVFRQEDYEMLIHWECPEPEKRNDPHLDSKLGVGPR